VLVIEKKCSIIYTFPDDPNNPTDKKDDTKADDDKDKTKTKNDPDDGDDDDDNNDIICFLDPD